MLLASVILAAWVLLARGRRWSALTIAAGGSLGALLMAYVAGSRWAAPGPENRAVLPAVFFILLSAAVGWGRLGRRGRWGAGILPVSLFLLPMAGTYQYQLGPFPYAEFAAIRTLPQWLQAQDTVLFTDIAWQEIFIRTYAGSVRTYAVHWVGTHSFMDEARLALARVLRELAPADRLWVVSSGPERFEAEAFLMQRLLEALPLRQVEILEDDTIVRRYGPGEQSPPRPVGALFGGTYLLRAASAPLMAMPGDTLSLLLTWEAVAKSEGHYAVFVHLRNSEGRTLAQGDSWPAQGLRPTGTWAIGEKVLDPHLIPLPADLPPGGYQLVAGLSSGSGRLPVGFDGNAVVVGEVAVVQQR